MIWHLLLVIVGDHPSFTPKWRDEFGWKWGHFIRDTSSHPHLSSHCTTCAGTFRCKLGCIEVNLGEQSLHNSTTVHLQWMKGPVIGRTLERKSACILWKSFCPSIPPRTHKFYPPKWQISMKGLLSFGNSGAGCSLVCLQNFISANFTALLARCGALHRGEEIVFKLETILLLPSTEQTSKGLFC